MTEAIIYGGAGIVALASIVAWLRERATWRLSDMQRRLAHWLMASAAARDAADAAFDTAMAQRVELVGRPERSGAGGAI